MPGRLLVLVGPVVLPAEGSVHKPGAAVFAVAAGRIAVCPRVEVPTELPNVGLPRVVPQVVPLLLPPAVTTPAVKDVM